MTRAIARGVAAVVVIAGTLVAGASCGVSDVPVLEANADSGVSVNPAGDLDAGASCGTEGKLCCDATCNEDGSFCSVVDHSCHSARPTDVGKPCTAGANCQSGLCTYLQGFDASAGANPASTTVCSEPCSGATDCLAGWTCWMRSEGPLVVDAAGAGTCVCSPVPESCDGKDDNCDGVIDEEPGASVACTTASGFPSKCVDAGCACTERCNGECVNLTDDPENCGACGRQCLPGLQVCSDSECVCGGALCPLPDGGPGDAGYLVPDGGSAGSPAVCVDIESDPTNCGGCGIACAYACAGECAPLALATLSADDDAAAEGFLPAGAVASNGSDVIILTAANGGIIEKCAVAGCDQNPVTIAFGLDNTNNTGSGGLLALGGSWAYWPGQTAVEDVTTTVPVVSVFAQPANASVYGVATNATQVFWSDTSLGISSCALGATCASPTALVPMSVLGAPAQVLAADDGYVYWMDANGGVFSSPLGGGAPVLLTASDDAGEGIAGYPMAMVAWAGRVYYVDAETGQLATALGGIGSSAAVYSTHRANALATDGSELYWAAGSSIFKCALGASCGASSVIYGGTHATALAVDARSTYWIDDGSNDAGVPQVWEFHK